MVSWFIRRSLWMVSNNSVVLGCGAWMLSDPGVSGRRELGEQMPVDSSENVGL